MISWDFEGFFGVFLNIHEDFLGLIEALGDSLRFHGDFPGILQGFSAFFTFHNYFNVILPYSSQFLANPFRSWKFQSIPSRCCDSFRTLFQDSFSGFFCNLQKFLPFHPPQIQLIFQLHTKNSPNPKTQKLPPLPLPPPHLQEEEEEEASNTSTFWQVGR